MNTRSYILVVNAKSDNVKFIANADITFRWLASPAYLDVENVLTDEMVMYALPCDEVTARLIATKYSKTHKKATVTLMPTAEARRTYRWTNKKD